MTKKILKGLDRISTVKAIIILLLFFMISYFMINGNIVGVAKLETMTGGTSILDITTGYTVDEAYDLLESLGDSGRQHYLSRIIPIDFVFPISYALFFMSVLTMLIRTNYKDRRNLQLLGLIPITCLLFDYSENICVINLLLNYPTRLTTLTKVSSVFTQIKFTMFAVSILMIVMFGVMLIVKLLNRRKAG